MISTERLKELQAATDEIHEVGEISDLASELIEARKELAALRWTPITPDNLPKADDDEVGGYDPALTIPSWRIRLVSKSFLADLDIPQWRRMGYTHFRPINPPLTQEKP